MFHYFIVYVTYIEFPISIYFCIAISVIEGRVNRFFYVEANEYKIVVSRKT